MLNAWITLQVAKQSSYGEDSLTQSSSCPWAHKAITRTRHCCLSFAFVLSSPQLIPYTRISFSKVRHQVSLGLPLAFLPGGDQRMATVEMTDGSIHGSMVLGQKMFRIRRKQQFWNVSSLRPMALVNFHNSHPYNSLVRTLLLKTFGVWSLVFMLIFLLFQMFLRELNACPSLESLTLIFGSESPSVVILGPRYVNSLTSSTTFPCRMIGASERWFILVYLVFFVIVLTLSPKIAAVDARSSVINCMSVWRWARRPMSSAKSRSLNTWKRVHRMPL